MVVKNNYHKIYRLKFYYFYLKTKSKWARKETLFCWGPLIDFSYSTFLRFSCPLKSFSQHLLLHFSKKRKRKRVWYFLLYAFNFRCSHPLSLVLLCSSSKKKKFIVKSKIFPTFYLIFVAVFRLLFNFRCSHPLSLVLLCSSSKKKKNYSKEWDFSDFLLNLRCSFLCYHPHPIVLILL